MGKALAGKRETVAVHRRDPDTQSSEVFIENENLRIEFDESTGLTSRIVDKKANATAKMTQQLMYVQSVVVMMKV